MAVVTADRAKELSTTTGTGAFTLTGAVSGFQSWATAFGSGVTAGISYCIHGGSEWEVGKGSFNGTTMVLTRTTVEASSNAGAAVNFSAGAKEVFATFTEVDAVASGGAGGSGTELPIDAAATASVGSGDLFAGTSLDGGWSSLQATGVTSVDRSVAGYCILKNTGNTAGQDRGLKRTFAPAGDFTVYASIPFATLVDNYQWAGIFIGETDPSDGAGADRLGFHLVINTTLKAKAAKYAAGAETVVFDQAVNNAALMLSAARGDYQTWFPVWLRIKRVGSTVTMGISWDGVQFIDLATTTTIAFTVGTIGFYIGESTATRDIRAVFNYVATTG